MPRRLTAVIEDGLAAHIDALARENGVSEQEVVRQLLEAGLDALDHDVRQPVEDDGPRSLD